MKSLDEIGNISRMVAKQEVGRSATWFELSPQSEVQNWYRVVKCLLAMHLLLSEGAPKP
jgi:hypothetical protein